MPKRVYFFSAILLMLSGCSEHPAYNVAQEACLALKEGDKQTLKELSIVQMAGKLEQDYLVLGSTQVGNKSALKNMECKVIRMKEGGDGVKIIYIRKMKPLYVKEIEGEWKIIPAQ